MNSQLPGPTARSLRAFVIASTLALSLLAAPSTAGATDSSSGYYADVCAIEASPSFQTTDLKAPGAKASFAVKATKKPDYVGTVKTKGCDATLGGVTVRSIPASGIKVTWTITHGPGTGATGSGYTDGDGQVRFSYTGCGCGKDIIKLSAVERWCETPDTPLANCSANRIKTYVLHDQIKVDWVNCSDPPPPDPTSLTGPTGPTQSTELTAPTNITGQTIPTSPADPISTTAAETTKWSVKVSLRKRCDREYMLIKPSIKNGAPASITIYVGKRRYARVTETPFQYKLRLNAIGGGIKTVRVVFRFADGGKQTVVKRFKNCARFSANARRSPGFTG
ncbi:MAG: hypothetical protein WAO61_09570 [Solirubrobacterales bacterium]